MSYLDVFSLEGKVALVPGGGGAIGSAIAGALAGAGAWGLLWIKGGIFVADHVWPVGLFALALGIVGVFGLKGRAILDDDSGHLTGPGTMSQPLVIALAGLAVAVLLL